MKNEQISIISKALFLKKGEHERQFFKTQSFIQRKFCTKIKLVETPKYCWKHAHMWSNILFSHIIRQQLVINLMKKEVDKASLYLDCKFISPKNDPLCYNT